jgi:hypothetical protein
MAASNLSATGILLAVLLYCAAQTAVAIPVEQPASSPAPAPGSAPVQSAAPAAVPATREPAQTETAKQRGEHRSFIAWLEQVTGLSATSSGLRDGEGDERGELWVQPLAGGAPRQLTAEGRFSWPVFSADDRQVLALRHGNLWAIPAHGGHPVELAHPDIEIVSLAGCGREGLVVLTADGVGIVNVRSGRFSPFEAGSREDRAEIAMLRSPGRTYDQGRLTVAERNGVLVVTEHGKIREMAYNGAASWQPSASHDRRWIAFIRTYVSP